MLLTDEGEPESFEEAKRDTHNRKWLSVMHDEMDSLLENPTYELTELPRGKRALRNKWVYKLKPRDTINPPRYKAHIVVKGFQQKKEDNVLLEMSMLKFEGMNYGAIMPVFFMIIHELEYFKDSLDHLITDFVD